MPEHLVEDVMTCGFLGTKDVLNLGSTCKKLWGISKRNLVWKKLFKLKFPYLLNKSLVITDGSNTLVGNHWMDVYHQTNLIIKALNEISTTHNTNLQLDDEDFETLLNYSKQFTFKLVLCILRCLVDKPRDLTTTYYANKALVYLKCCSLTEEIKQLVETPDPSMTLLMQGAMLVSDWFKVQTDIDQSEVKDFIRTSAQLIRDRSCDLTLLQAANHIFQQNFSGNQQNYYDISNSFIDDVIKTQRGIPITLCLIFREISSHVGLNLHPVACPSHFLLRMTNPGGHKFIDVFNDGKVQTFEELGLKEELLKTTTNVEVLSRICRNINAHSKYNNTTDPSLAERVLNLSVLLEPTSEIFTSNFQNRAERLKFLFRINKNLHTMLEDNTLVGEEFRGVAGIASRDRSTNIIKHQIKNEGKEKNSENKIQIRSADENARVMFSVGTVTRHLKYGYVCVVRGWDNYCDMSVRWQRLMGIPQLNDGATQPYYNVLVHEDGSERYAAQENLEVLKGGLAVEHEEIGKYFQSIKHDDGKIYYEPNQQLKLEYPEDMAHTITLCQQ
uniref:Hemimethylated DNA-binding domain-containing protein n=1 Tax=Ciona intestinalis TaxID=7719 RepID=F7B5M3_CIOIN